MSSYEGYQNFTEDNFLVVVTSITASTSDLNTNGWVAGSGASAKKDITKKYDATTGTLTISGYSATASEDRKNGSTYLKCKAIATAKYIVYLVY